MKVTLLVIDKDSNNERIQMDFNEPDKLLKKFKIWRRKYPNGEFYAYNRTKATKPPEAWDNEWGTQWGTKWCPYCADERHFDFVKSVDYKECGICGISEGHYYVRQYNL